MREIIRGVLMVVCVAILAMFSGCSDVTEGLDAIATNTTVDEATADIANIRFMSYFFTILAAKPPPGIISTSSLRSAGSSTISFL